MGYKNTYTLREREREGYKNKGTARLQKQREKKRERDRERVTKTRGLSSVTKWVTKTQTSYPCSRKNRTADSIPNISTWNLI